MQKSKHSIGILIPTLNAEKHLPHCLPFWIQSPLKPKVLVLDSSSTDHTITLARQLGADTAVIQRHEFNHGLTREKGRKLLNTDIVVMVTQDAYPVNQHVLETLTAPLLTSQASVTYARQIPHDHAHFFEAFPRFFNYPATSQLRTIQDVNTYGVYTFFCSNSCAAYCNKALDEIGGFKKIPFGEDALAVTELLHRGHRIAYVAEAKVKHSHHYTLMQEFKRHFEMGKSRKQIEPLLACAGNDQKRGREYVRSLTKALMNHDKTLLPYAYLQTGFKWLGYQLGRMSI